MELLRCRLKARGQLITPSNQLINCASRVHAIEVDGQSLTCFLQLRKQLIVNGDGPPGCLVTRRMLDGAEETIIGKGKIGKETRRFAPMTFQFVSPSSGFTSHLQRSCFVSHTKEIGPNYMHISSLVLTLMNIFHYLCLGNIWSTLACNYRMMSFFCIFMWSPQGDPSIYLGFYGLHSLYDL